MQYDEAYHRHSVLLNNCQTFLICISSKKHYENEQSSTRKFIHTFSKIFKITNYLGHTYLVYIHKTIMLRPDYPRSGQQAAFNIYSQILKVPLTQKMFFSLLKVLI